MEDQIKEILLNESSRNHLLQLYANELCIVLFSVSRCLLSASGEKNNLNLELAAQPNITGKTAVSNN